ncbi:uncharacterized protein N7529_000641 [Penicillium soppii]|uniref:uncharacterized protein n=1 Tax=Penicillium soppii TaxID=69789 RepID=UPI00254680B3|nr:uncharacterized protein N7529_000641 [Penicillium soppii]KAJ5881969.1 hypothetical protein N7529_000641 [Penicillium soppii]
MTQQRKWEQDKLLTSRFLPVAAILASISPQTEPWKVIGHNTLDKNDLVPDPADNPQPRGRSCHLGIENAGLDCSILKMFQGSHVSLFA